MSDNAAAAIPQRETRCADIIHDALTNRLAQLVPDTDNMTLQECYNVIRDTSNDFPDPNPWGATTGEELHDMLGTDEEDRAADTRDVAALRAAVIAAIDAGDVDGLDDWRGRAAEVAQEAAQEAVLGVDVVVVKRVQLSCGGPADWIDFEFTREVDKRGNETLSLNDATYHRADWGDHAETRIDDDTAQQLVDLWGLDQ